MFLPFSLLLVVVGVGFGIWALARRSGSSDAGAVLDERLSRGEISVSEHRERRAALGSGRRGGGVEGAVALALLLIGLLGVGVSAVGSAGPRGGPMGGMMDGMPGMMGGGGGMMGGRSEGDAPPPDTGADGIEVAGDEFSFRPDEIRLRAGESVNITFSNHGGLSHTLTIDELDFELRASPDEQVSGSVDGVEPGRYTFVCTVGGHAEAGMRGVLVVEDAS